jgi:hypothetical protein
MQFGQNSTTEKSAVCVRMPPALLCDSFFAPPAYVLLPALFDRY